ncbi:putative glycosyltransferase [Paenibacillus sp. CECT 9249]|uniref:glycosyltransferase n=1 Tax=Paenibacillus sp. CECT 9249 TaxID=2845385 RepID=UPI001E371537|nr:glycosyltransferase [Paenibacillus sp. CECT 9249]CAH0121693.1 putative glycosyltransferase [Paenibacillus sp. CECT 9249]
MKEQTFASVVLYAHNDEQFIADSLRKIDSAMNNLFKDYEIIIVNDYSQDRTLEITRKAIDDLRGDITIINLSRKHGVEHAMMAGLNRSMGDFVYEIETAIIDFKTDMFRTLYETATQQRSDIVAASSDRTSITSSLFYKLINKLSYLDLCLSTEPVRLVSRRALNAMLGLKEKVRYRKALYSFTGYPKQVVHYEADRSVPLKSKKINRENISLALDVIVSFSNGGLKLAHYLSFFFFLFSIFMGGYALYNYAFNKSVVQGWTTLMILISAGFAGLFFIVGLVGEYISRILIEIQNRPFYSTHSVELYKEKQPNLQLVKKNEKIPQ